MTFFPNNERIRTLERTSKKGTHPRKERGHIMEKTTLKKIIEAVRELEIKKSRNDSQFEFYQKKKRRIERKERRALEKSSNIKEAIEHYKNNKETLDFCYGFMDKIEDENKVINNQIQQYLINWDIKTPEQEAQDNATIELDLNALKSKIEKLISDYNQERRKLTINQENYKYMYVRQD